MSADEQIVLGANMFPQSIPVVLVKRLCVPRRRVFVIDWLTRETSAFPFSNIFLEQAASADGASLFSPMPLRISRPTGFNRFQKRFEDGLRPLNGSEDFRGKPTRGHVVCFVVADFGGAAAQTKAPLHGFQQTAHRFASGRNLHASAEVGFRIDTRKCPVASAVEILGHVEGVPMTLDAESAAPFVDLVGIGARGAMSGMMGEGLHDIGLIVVGQARVVRDGGELNLTDERRHDDGRCPSSRDFRRFAEVPIDSSGG